MNRGKYIVLEGPEGVGKTTQLQELSRRLQAAGLPVRTLREPDSQSDLTARAIRQLTQDPRYPMNTRTEVLLYNAARAQSLQVIQQSVEHGVICLVDRNYLTTLAIQYYGRGDVPDYQAINNIISFAVGDMEPNLCIVLDAPVNILRERLKDRYNGERFDNLDDAFLERVRAGYLWEARQRDLPVVFATQESSAVADSIWQLVSQTLAIREPDLAATTAPTSVGEVLQHKQLTEDSQAAAPADEPPLPALSPEDQATLRQADTIQLIIEEASYLLAPRLGTYTAVGSETPRYYTPEGLEQDLAGQYQQAMDVLLASRASMLKQLTTHLKGNATTPKKERGQAWQDAITAQATDCLRAVLPVATVTGINLAQSRVDSDNLMAELLSQDLPEARQLALYVEEQGYEGSPLMLEDGSLVDGNEAVSGYRQAIDRQLQALAREHLPDNHAGISEEVKLTDYWPRNELLLIPDMLYEQSNLSLDQLQTAVSGWPYERKAEAFQAYIGNRQNLRQRPGSALEKAHYSWDLVTDYGTFLDLQQQLKADSLVWQSLTPRYGYSVHDLIEEAGLTEDFEACFEISLKLHSLLVKAGHPLQAQYATLLGHKMRWQVTYNALEAFRLLEMPSDHPALTALTAAMHAKLSEAHPLTAEAMSFAST